MIQPDQLLAAHRWFSLDDLELLPGNPNQGDRLGLASSVEELGWIDGIVVHCGLVLAGNHRVELARANGESGLPGYDLSGFGLDEATQYALALADNHTSRAGVDDPALLDAAHDLIAEVDLDLAELAGYVDPVSLLALAPAPDANPAATPAADPERPAYTGTRFMILRYPPESLVAVVADLDRLRRPGESNTDVILRVVADADR